MVAPKISFCMPTYNYGRYIRAALESIQSQGDENMEVIVLDGGSSDNTEEVVRGISENWPALRYVRQTTRGGIDADLARSVELATGEYCWLLSADDALERGAIRRVMPELDGRFDILLCNRTWCDADLLPVKTESWLTNSTVDFTVDLSKDEQLLHYFREAKSLGALFSFMSCIVFRRAAWMRLEGDTVRIPCYTHVGRLFAMGRQGARLRYVAAPLVLCRGGNDSFRADGLANRLLIDLRGFLDVGRMLFPGGGVLQESFLAVLRREHPWWRWVRVRGGVSDPRVWEEIRLYMGMFQYSRVHLQLINYLGALFGLLRSLMRAIRHRA